MAKSARKLKVFQTRIGFFDCVVAVPSQAAALRAWGIHQNVFASGAATTATDPGTIERARSQPGVTLKRAIGSEAAFSSEPALPQIPDEPAARPGAKPRKPKAGKAPTPKPVDRTPLNKAEEQLAAVQAEHARAEAAFQRRRRDLEAEQAQAELVFNERLADAEAERDHQRNAYKKAGGKD
jgi:hypothetical protein